MADRPNTLLASGAENRWAELDAQKRRLLARPESSIEERLRRGQRLSTQAAALRRALVDGRRKPA